MKLKLADLDPHFLKAVSRLDYECTDDIAEADALQLRCPACHWAGHRTGNDHAHAIILWRDPASWRFAGQGYRDVSLMAGRTLVTMVGGCRARFYLRDGKVDFS